MITINLDKAKDIAHDKRRAARAVEFAPLDIKATIPSEAAAAEAERVLIREKYDIMQSAIDESQDVAILKQVIADIL